MGSAFVRVLDPADPWVEGEKYTDEQRQSNFRGRADWNISVAMVARCPPRRVLAALYGQRRDPVLDLQAVFRFLREEVEAAGGVLHDTPSDPPWPQDYCHAHHDVVQAHDAVAAHMAELYSENQGRVVLEDELVILKLIAEMLGRADVHKKFKRGASYRFKRMFLDGGTERDLWTEVAKGHPYLLEQRAVSRELRKMYQDKNHGRSEWATLMDAVGLSASERERFR